VLSTEKKTKSLTWRYYAKIDNRAVKAQIWDTSGQERYRAITGA
jgi:GTPase SAR1 family protein